MLMEHFVIKNMIKK